jgi:putative nucleotidyltransferase with HDIG domain
VKKSKILIVDDDASIRKFVRINLLVRGYKVSVAENGIEALNIFKKEKIDLVILDIMMPYLDGYEVCHRIREVSKVPIIMLSAREAENDKLRCLEAGADDYITKPFSLEELLCRIKVIFRRTLDTGYSKVQPLLHHEDLTIDQDQFRVYFKNQEIKLTDTECRLLAYLAMSAGRVISREQLLGNVWGQKYEDNTHLLSVYMSRLRSKINSVGAGNNYIQTVTGIGYMIAENNYDLNYQGKPHLKIAPKIYQAQLEDRIANLTAEIQRLSLNSIEALIYALEAKDKYTAGHSKRVSDISIALGRALGLDESEMDDLRWGSLLHDVGKIAIDPLIQNKPGRLTKEEYEHIMIHPQVGSQIVKPIVNQKVVDIIEHHHDHFDGSGLHQHVKGSEIPRGARIIAIADAFDAMTSDRPYHSKINSDEALKEIQQCRFTQFDPAIASVFIRSRFIDKISIN